jgi:dolichol-phosphate mannosyltransferase
MSDAKPRVMVGVGVYNEQRTISEVLSRFEPGVADEIVVMDDGSTDRTPEIIAQAGLACIRHEKKQGVGAGILSLIRYGLDHDYDVIVLMAGNGKDDPREIPRLLEPILSQGYDYVQGSRYIDGVRTPHQPWKRTLLVHMLAWFYRIVTGFHSTDPSNGFRAYKLSILQDPRINLWQNWLAGYELEHYLNYLVIKLGYRVTEAPVTKTYPGQRGVRYTHVRPFIDQWKSLRPIFFLMLGLKK